ncbi:hypothetical protein C7271_12435 [filamentous cyanobacterium CCP5]|nr:hypothetical protein C7271_12435 [filamentous cyanobacterium CCP5]
MTQPSRRRSWVGTLVAPLFVISLGLHGLLLFFPLPSGSDDTAEEMAAEPEPEEEEAVDLLSISTLATEEPEPIPETLADAPPPEPATAQPAAPQPAVPKLEPAVPPPAASPPEPAPDEFSEPDPAATDSPSSNFDPARQQQLAGNAASVLGREPGKSNFDVTSGFPGNAWDLPVWKTDLSRWSASKRSCFFNSINGDSYSLASGASDLRYLSRNLGLVVSEDLPRTFPNQTIQSVDGGYCDERLFRVIEDDTPILWLSIIGIGDGDPPATAIVIFWRQNPRG